MDRLKQFGDEHFAELDQYMPIVERVHGPHHAEIYEVAKVYDAIKGKIVAGERDLDADFARLRELTDGYQVPGDVCETYALIYNVLGELDRVYESQ